MERGFAKKEEEKYSGEPLTQFSGFYAFLSIDYPCNVVFQGFNYPSVAMAFQAARTNDASLRRKISEVKDQEQFKNIVTAIKSSPGWNEKRLNVMLQLNRDKFKRNKDIALKLSGSQSRYLINGYPNGGAAESFWGMTLKNKQYEGLNSLGKILMEIREDMKKGTESLKWVQCQNIEKDQSMWPGANLIVEKEGEKIGNLLLLKKNVFLFGSHIQSDFKLQHGSISKFHAAVYFSTDMEVILVDLNSTHGTAIVRGDAEIKLEPLRPYSLGTKDAIIFGGSTRQYICCFGYDQVERRMGQQEQEFRDQLEKIERLKNIEGTDRSQLQKHEAIKSLLSLKEYACLFVEGLTRAWSYHDLKEIFHKYGPVKNVRINIDPKTGRYMGSALIYYQKGAKINNILDNIAEDKESNGMFKIRAVDNEEADSIIASFNNKPSEKRQTEKEGRGSEKYDIEQRRKHKVEKRSRSRSRDRRRNRHSDSQ